MKTTSQFVQFIAKLRTKKLSKKIIFYKRISKERLGAGFSSEDLNILKKRIFEQTWKKLSQEVNIAT